MPHRKLRGSRVYLAPIEESDAAKWVEWLNDPEVAIPLGDEAYMPITARGVGHYFNGVCDKGEHTFTIRLMEDDSAIGRCLLFNVDPVNRSGNLGIFIGEKGQWGKGFGAEALNLLLDFAFNLLNLNSMMLGAFSFNERALKCYRSVGFKEIGRRREARIIAGKAYDTVFMDILASEFCGESQVRGIMESYG